MLLVVTALLAGCRQTPVDKQARLIAAENLQLRKDLADRDGQIGKLKADYEEQLQQKDEELAACYKRNQVLENDVQKAVGERVEQVTAAVMAENAKLRKEIETLRAKAKDP
jgi:hypothetical protein